MLLQGKCSCLVQHICNYLQRSPLRTDYRQENHRQNWSFFVFEKWLGPSVIGASISLQVFWHLFPDGLLRKADLWDSSFRQVHVQPHLISQGDSRSSSYLRLLALVPFSLSQLGALFVLLVGCFLALHFLGGLRNLRQNFGVYRCRWHFWASLRLTFSLSFLLSNQSTYLQRLPPLFSSCLALFLLLQLDIC